MVEGVMVGGGGGRWMVEDVMVGGGWWEVDGGGCDGGRV